MPSAPSRFDDFCTVVQKATLPGIWSKGVALQRTGSAVEDMRSKDEDEFIFKVRVVGKPTAARVKLWLDDQDWHCDCGEKVEPCSHIAAAAIALKMQMAKVTPGDPAAGAAGDESAEKTAGAGKSATAPSKDADSASKPYRTGVAYYFRRQTGKLLLERRIQTADYGQDGSVSQPLVGPLVAFAGGVQSGRISSPGFSATQADFTADRAHIANNPELLLLALEDCPRIFLDDQPVTAGRKPLVPQARVYDGEKEGFRLEVKFDSGPAPEIFTNGIALTGTLLRPCAQPRLRAGEEAFLAPRGKFYPFGDRLLLANEVLRDLERRIALKRETTRLPTVEVVPPRIRIVTHIGKSGELLVHPSIVYGDPVLAEVREGRLQLLQDQTIPVRDPSSEQRLTRELQGELHLRPGQLSRFEGAAAVDFNQRLKTAKARVEGPGHEAFEVRGRLNPRVELGQKGEFNLDFEFTGANGAKTQVAADSVFNAWRSGTLHVSLPGAAGVGELPLDWLQRYGRRALDLLSHRTKGQKLPSALWLDASALAEDADSPIPDVLARARDLLRHHEKIPESPLPKDLQAELRHYQQQGVNWLCYLRDLGLGALLADDMGLGKTLQTLCSLEGKSLVIAPTSVMESWRDQIKSFRPGLKVHIYHGSNREWDASADLVLTTYGVLRADPKVLVTPEWDAVVLDEAQTIRNPDSQVARAAHRLRAKFRIALSGTPIENRIEDLWSLFQFVNPGVLGPREEFVEQYKDPSLLRNRIRPFLLRRLKKEVAKELPPRTETVLHVELSTEEREAYQTIWAATQSEVVEGLESGEVSVLTALEALLRLRQACCHCGLLPGQAGAFASSTKVELLTSSLVDAIASGHRALVFSQWTGLLDRIETRFAKEGWSKGKAYLRLDGSTTNRGEIIDAFQAPGGPPILLLSLKAGGVGLTLTAADQVFIVDPWWNPAAENQAADRAHRIGQMNPVLIQRLVARDTVEERILELQARKSELAQAILEGADASAKLTREDLLGIFK